VLASKGLEQAMRDTQATALAQLGHRLANLSSERDTQDAIDAENVRALNERVRGMQAERRQLEASIAIQQERTASAGQAVARFADLRTRKFVTEVQTEEKRAEFLDQQGRLQELLRSRATLDREIAGAQRELAAADLSAVKRRSLDDGRSRDRGRTGRRGFALNFNSSSTDEAFTSIP
jgi:hypothetical protein